MLDHDRIKEIRQAGGEAAVQEFMLQDRKDRDEAKKQGGRRENKNFTQIYPEGWQRLQALMKQDANAARVYAFFAEHMGPDGTLCVSRGTLSEALEVTERTISRHVKTLEKLNAIVILKIGTANVYCLNPNEVWKSFDNAKPYAAFRTKTLIGKTENPFVKRRLAALLGGKEPEQKDWLEDIEEDVEAEIGMAAE